VLTFIICIPLFSSGQDHNKEISLFSVCLNKEERALYEKINKYRKDNGLSRIPLSRSLTYVAKLHAEDLSENNNITAKCNMHSWSDKGEWSPCCYTADHKKSECMWLKPRELTNYTGYGYEIAFFSTYQYDETGSYANDAINQWSRSKGHNSVILNLGLWKDINWQSLGVGIHNGYSTVWFGEETDPEPPVSECQ
jgi:uncharacterized protein YkwD